MNPPFNASKNETLAEEIIKFFEKYLDIKRITEIELVAYHVVPSRRPLPAGIMPTVIVKFVQFHRKALFIINRR